MHRSFLFILLVFCLSGSAWAAQGKLLELLVDQVKLTSFLGKKGIQDQVATQVQSSVQNSLLSLAQRKANSQAVTGSELQSILARLEPLPSDNPYRAKLMDLLSRDVSQLTDGDLAEAVNNLVYLANRYGQNQGTILACSACNSGGLAGKGFKFSLGEIQDTSVRKALESMVPENPTEVKKKIAVWMRRLNAGTFKEREAAQVIPPEEMRAFALFLAMAQKNSPADPIQREFINGVMDISRRPDGSVKLIDPQNPHKLWSLLVSPDRVGDKYMKEISVVLKEAAQAANGENQVGKKNAFFSVLRRKSGGDPEAQKMIASLKKKGCFFK